MRVEPCSWLRILNLGIDTATVRGRLVRAIIAAAGAMTRNRLIERTHTGYRNDALAMAEISRSVGLSTARYRHIRTDRAATDRPVRSHDDFVIAARGYRRLRICGLTDMKRKN